MHIINNFTLSNFGQGLWDMIQPLIFYGKHQDFFLTHSINSIPQYLQFNLNKIFEAELIKGAGNLLNNIAEALEIPRKEIWIMSTDSFPMI